MPDLTNKQRIDNVTTELVSATTDIQNFNIIPSGIFIQETIPVKTTNEAIWLQKSNVVQSNFIENIPNSVLNWTISSNLTVSDFLNTLTINQKTLVNSFKHQVIFINNEKFYLLASNNLYYDPNNNFLVTVDSINKAYFTYDNTGITDYTSDSNVYTAQLLDINESYTDKNIYNQSGTKITISAYTSTANYLEIIVNNKKYSVQTNKGNQFNKILDSAVGNINSTDDLMIGKVAISNNIKYTGTYEPGINKQVFDADVLIAEDILGISEGSMTMTVFNEIIDRFNPYEGFGGTYEQVEAVLDDILEE